LRQRIGDNARRYIMIHNSVEETVRGYLRVLEQVTGRQPCALQEEGSMDEKQRPEEWLDVPALMAAIRREIARQAEQGQLAPPDWERFQTVDTEWLMEEIRVALAKRWHAGELEGPDMGRYHIFDSIPQDLEQNLNMLGAHWNQLYEPFEAKRQTPLLGDLWARIRRRIHEEVRSYLDPMIFRQSELNGAIVGSLNTLARGFYGGSLARSLQVLHQEVGALREQVRSLQEQLRVAGSQPSSEGEA
jgi:hypothetical protein